MSNKICGECKYRNPISGICIKLGKKPSNTLPSCPYRPTNGDRIRQKSNEEFARAYVHYHSKFKIYVARLCPLNKQLWTTREEAEKANLEWLNAPADCVKQKPENKTQTDLCKADYTKINASNGFAKCKFCGKTYQKKKKAQLFCSIKCKDRWWNRERAVDREYLHPQCEDNFNGEW